MKTSLRELRTRLKRQRSGLTPAEQKHLSAQAIQHLQRSKLFRSARNIAIYLPVRGEIDPSELPRYGRSGQKFYLPVLSLYKPHGLTFIRWDKDTRFRNNRFRIPEPLVKHKKLKSSRQMDLVVMPLLAFDLNGSRLGMGGGFYDRSFAFKNSTGRRAKPVLLGIAYQFQQVETLPRQPWDVSLDAVVTNLQLQKFN
ncbi:MAG: 5-formyltetrahydrofolate cyclo-ligase [Thiolinea sp.]